ncbi:putative F-box/kelch-repeat protein [Cardamine amara subsp. amara]|uniref:F-box/kelch-repeat protein n=1 Tax=Cardamine amara subsp. amara TaxID=228776 RepID=A0ABD1BJL9_CARAN
MNDLPLDLLDEILFKMEPKSLVMIQCTNKSFHSYLSDPKFDKYFSWARPSLFNLFNYGRTHTLCCFCDSISPGNELQRFKDCYTFGSCSGLLLLYIDRLFIANPATKRFRILDHSGSKLVPKIVGGDEILDKDACYRGSNIPHLKRAMCVGFVVNRNQTTTRFKIVCILEMEMVYGFEISDGDSWRLSKTTITTSSKSDLRMKPVYLDDTLHWLRDDGSIIAFNPETEQARLIPSRFHQKNDMSLLLARDDKINRLTLISWTTETISVYILLENSEWTLTKRIKKENIYMDGTNRERLHMIAYDGKYLVVKTYKKDRIGLFHVYDIEANTWTVLWSTPSLTSSARDLSEFTPSKIL